ncbi:hypothetical protein [Bacillus sp. 03113]|uniref:hypothetical protein n=1 Tax=Bacillus sp. 03113 TaxID=2578211 RepID=UPI001141E018|nr:hypothetical protein [Bacillus sp. 03113]
MNERERIKESLITQGFDVVNVVTAWSNGSKIRRYQGQGEGSEWHSPKDGYRKMYAVLIEVKEATE